MTIHLRGIVVAEVGSDIGTVGDSRRWGKLRDDYAWPYADLSFDGDCNVSRLPVDAYSLVERSARDWSHRKDRSTRLSVWMSNASLW